MEFKHLHLSALEIFTSDKWRIVESITMFCPTGIQILIHVDSSAIPEKKKLLLWSNDHVTVCILYHTNVQN